MTFRALLLRTAWCRLVLPALLVGLVAGSADAQILVHGALARDHAATAGQTYREVISVHNASEDAQQARLYLTDYHFTADGTNAYGESGSSERSNADWVSFAPPLLTVPPGETVEVTLTVDVPTDVADGSYWSILMVEAIPRGSAESTLDDGDALQFGVVERVRYGIQIATHLGDPSTEVGVVAAQVLPTGAGGKLLSVDVENTGRRMLDGPVYLDVFDVDGTARGRIAGSAARLYPGTSFRHRVDLSTLPPGSYEALLVVDGGDAGVFGTQYTLDL